MLISGIQKFTTLDFPEKLACIVFTPGCNFRCGYCHNPEFVLPEKIAQLKSSFIPEEAFWNFLKKRGKRERDSAPLLDGVVISGGEPTVMPDLVPFMEKIKSLGFLVKLDTNGNRPEVIEQAMKRGAADYIAMDVKTSLAEYQRLAGSLARAENIKRSIELIKAGGVAYEFRSTLIREIHTPDILSDMRELVRGAKQLFLQSFRPGQTLNPTFGAYQPFTEAEMRELERWFGEAVERVERRQ